jgi:uncharacterized coiled-coil protein SlyX
MSDIPREERLSTAQLRVAEGEERVARQEIIIGELERDGHAELAVNARAVLAAFKTSLQLLRDDLWRIENEPPTIRSE